MSTASEQREQLVDAAIAAMREAYAPYSKYQVGAALLTDDGSIVTGCNVENASYGLTMCAERVAVGAAVAGGHSHFAAIAISTIDGGAPCGACRQVLAEFSPEMSVAMHSTQTGETRDARLLDLLPDLFTLDDESPE